ncbi:Zinc finger, C2H2 [Artemisia annua]|uniref:Zinc finger, C2H2 n=1 Tax=Artemisia annua TaxID=35608 RepID=A0A2U1NBU6_ARTAN|nr:Zinc finger, C2H2 [Artemisia annua]
MMSGDGFSSSPSSLSAFIQEPSSNANPNPNSSNSSKRKRNLPGTPDPDAEVIALSPRSLMATNRFVCEICNKGFQRDQNLQLHRRGHNLPWKLKQRNKLEIVKKKVYICPEVSCVHHDPSRALGDLTGVKKHFSRKHGEKKWKCEKCSKKITDNGIFNLQRMTRLTRVNLSKCGDNVSDSGILGLTQIPYIRILDLSWLINVTDTSLIYIASMVLKLKLFFFGCEAITGEGLHAFAHHPTLEDLKLVVTIFLGKMWCQLLRPAKS